MTTTYTSLVDMLLQTQKLTAAGVQSAYLRPKLELKQAAVERQDISFAYLAVHELESILSIILIKLMHAPKFKEQASKQKLPQASWCNSAKDTSTAAATQTSVHSITHPAAQNTHDMLHICVTGCKATEVLQSHLLTCTVDIPRAAISSALTVCTECCITADDSPFDCQVLTKHSCKRS